MTLATLFNIPSDPFAFQQFSFSNAEHHVLIANAIQTLYNQATPAYILDPIPVLDSQGGAGVWLYNHQAVHNFQNAVLGIAGNDLTGVDWQKPDEVADWINLHAEEHRTAATRLGI